MCSGLCSAHSSIEIVNYKYRASDRPGLGGTTADVISCSPPPPTPVDPFKWAHKTSYGCARCSGNGFDGDVYFAYKLPNQASHIRMVS
uniref:Secreted protein n=1 Tax=Rodentolepis nana TaxID=102285 RepID=A0A0R3TYC1_RODNA